MLEIVGKFSVVRTVVEREARRKLQSDELLIPRCG
jgi:hypothetical protein